MADRQSLPSIPERFTDWSTPGAIEIHQPEQCGQCRHRIPNSDRCTAFPAGIPIAILADEHDHRRRFPGDHGILFTPIPRRHRS